MSNDVNDGRRRLLTTVTTGVGLAGATALAVPLVASMKPSARALAAGAPVEVDIEDLAPGQMKVVEWRGKPVWILRRDKAMLADLEKVVSELSDPDSAVAEQQPVYAQNATRSIRPDVLVVLGVCTHLGCAPPKNFETGAPSGFGEDWGGGSSAHVMAPSLIFLAASSKTCRRPLTWWCHRTVTWPTIAF